MGVIYLEYINAKYSGLLGLISAEGKYVHIYSKLRKRTQVIAVDALLSRVSGTCGV